MQHYLIVKRLINLSNNNKLPVFLLRPRKFDQQTVFDGDFDFLANMQEFLKILDFIFQQCLSHKISFTVKRESAFKTEICLLSDNKQQVKLEFWSIAKFKTSFVPNLFSSAAIDYFNYTQIEENQRNTLNVALFILHLHHKQKNVQEKTQQWRIKHYLSQDIDVEIKNALLLIKDTNTCTEQAHLICLDYLKKHNIQITNWKNLAIQKLVYFLKANLRLSAIRTIAVIGPDGSGKTSLIEQFNSTNTTAKYKTSQFKRLFRRPLYHIHTKEPRNIRDEKMTWLILPVAWASFIVYRCCSNWQRTLILDRYFYDYLATDVRSTDKPLKPIKTYNFWTKLVPSPNKLIIAMCPIDIIRARKNELSPQNIRRLYQFYLKLSLKNNAKSILFCNTNTQIEKSLHDLQYFLTNHN